MRDILFAATSFLILMLFIGLTVFFGWALLVLIFISAALFPLFIRLQRFYMNWRYKGVFKSTDPDNFQEPSSSINANNIPNTDNIGNNKIIDVEYQEIPAKK